MKMQGYFSPEEYRASLLEQLSAGGPEWKGTPQEEFTRSGSAQDANSLSAPQRHTFADPSQHSFRFARRPHARPGEDSRGEVQVDSSLLLDTHSLCSNGGSGCPTHRSLVIDFIDNCVANNVPEPVIARQVEFMISAMQEMIGMHAALQERFHKDRQREYEISQLTSAVERQTRLRQQERLDRREHPHGELGRALQRRRTPSPTRLQNFSTEQQTQAPPVSSAAQETGKQSWRQSASLSPSEKAGSARLSPLRYGRAAYHLVSPTQHERLQRENELRSHHNGGGATLTTSPRRLQFHVSNSPSTARDTSPVEAYQPSTHQEEQSPKPRARPHGHSARYLQPTHASVAHRSTSRSTIAECDGHSGRDCAYCNRQNGACHSHSTSASHTAAWRKEQRPVRRLRSEDLMRARESATRPTKASLLRAEAVTERQRKTSATSADDSVSKCDDTLTEMRPAQKSERRAPSRRAPPAPRLSATSESYAPPPPLTRAAPQPRLSIEKRNGNSDSRNASSVSFTDLLRERAGRERQAANEEENEETTANTLHTTNTFVNEEGLSGLKEESPSVNLEREQIQRDFAELLKRSTDDSFNAQRASNHRRAGAVTEVPRSPRLSFRHRDGDSVPLTSPELQLFIEMSQRKIRESERVVARTTPNVSAIAESSTLITNASSAFTGPSSFTVHTPPPKSSDILRRTRSTLGAKDGLSPMVEISPTSSDED